MKRRLLAPAALVVLAGLGHVTPAVAALLPLDAYPYAAAAAGTRDAWGFTARECVSYVAWRLHQAGESGFANVMSRMGHASTWGDAGHWDFTAQELGYGVGTTPRVGAVAQWHSNERTVWVTHSVIDNTAITTTHWSTASPYGHVGIVTQVNADGTAVIDEYNGAVARGFSSSTQRAPRYLYITGDALPVPMPTLASIRLTHSSSGGVVRLTLATSPSSKGALAYFFRRSGLTGRVLPYGTARIDAEGNATQVTREQVGQQLSLYGTDNVASSGSPYSNAVSFRVS